MFRQDNVGPGAEYSISYDGTFKISVNYGKGWVHGSLAPLEANINNWAFSQQFDPLILQKAVSSIKNFRSVAVSTNQFKLQNDIIGKINMAYAQQKQQTAHHLGNRR